MAARLPASRRSLPRHAFPPAGYRDGPDLAAGPPLAREQSQRTTPSLPRLCIYVSSPANLHFFYLLIQPSLLTANDLFRLSSTDFSQGNRLTHHEQIA